MPQRSWLAKAKTIYDLGPHYTSPRGDKPWDEKREARVDAKRIERVRRPLPVEDAYQPYFGSKMHDSWLLGIERTEALLRVRLDSINADIFAIGLADMLEIPRKTERWPVDLLLHQPVYVRAARYGPTGSFRHVDPYETHYEARHRADQLLYDWFFEQDGRVQWVAEIWAWRREIGPLSTEKFLMVDASRATAYDGQRPALEKSFGSAGGVLWQEAVDGVDVGDALYGPWSVQTMEDFLIRRMAVHGLRRDDFL